MSDFEERRKSYSKDCCWQYSIRQENVGDDLLRSGLTKEEVERLTCKDFLLAHESKEDCFSEIKDFIERHEWLGKLSLYPTNFFTARYKGILAGVVIMDMPNAFSKMLGEGTRKIERVISRGACISWSPKNLGSNLVMFSIRWMVNNTRFRLFSAYSDVEARELGTIYQACNFYYLGNTFGAGNQYRIREDKWVSDRYFRSRSCYKKIAKDNGIVWVDEWQRGDVILFNEMPESISILLKNASKMLQNSCPSRQLPKKHKYAYVLGVDKKETKTLRTLFEGRNKIYPYPKVRGINNG